MFSCGICETFNNSCGCFWKHVTYYYIIKNSVGYKCYPFTLLHLLLTQWWDMRLKHDVAWLWEEWADNRKVCLKWKKHCSCCIILIRIDTILSKNLSRIIFKICFPRSCCPFGHSNRDILEVLHACKRTLVAQNHWMSVRLYH